MTTVLDNVVTALRGIGYKVSLTPHEKIELKEFVITLDKVDIETETNESYFMTTTYNISFISESIVEIVEKIPQIIAAIEQGSVTTMRDFQSITPEIVKQDGTLYLIHMKFSYKDVVTM